MRNQEASLAQSQNEEDENFNQTKLADQSQSVERNEHDQQTEDIPISENVPSEYQDSIKTTIKDLP